MWLTFLIVIVVDWSGASVTPRGLSVQDETLERAARVKRLIGRPLESTLAERKSTTSYGEEPIINLKINKNSIDLIIMQSYTNFNLFQR